MIDTIFVPRGAEANAVHRAAERVGSPVRVVTTGIGPHAASLAVDAALAGPTIGCALVTGLCGLLSPGYVVGDALVYGEIVRDGDRSLLFLDRDVSDDVAGRIPRVQTGIRAVSVDRIVTQARAKVELGTRHGAHAVDMESFALAARLHEAGVAVAVARIASDGAQDDLPDLHMALDGSGGLDTFALALAMLRRPVAGFHLARNGTRALAALEDTVAAILR